MDLQETKCFRPVEDAILLMNAQMDMSEQNAV